MYILLLILLLLSLLRASRYPFFALETLNRVRHCQLSDNVKIHDTRHGRGKSHLHPQGLLCMVFFSMVPLRSSTADRVCLVTVFIGIEHRHLIRDLRVGDIKGRDLGYRILIFGVNGD